MRGPSVEETLMDALAVAREAGLYRFCSSAWQSAAGGKDLFTNTLVQRLIDRGLVYATSSDTDGPKRLKATKAGRDLLEEAS